MEGQHDQVSEVKGAGLRGSDLTDFINNFYNIRNHISKCMSQS